VTRDPAAEAAPLSPREIATSYYEKGQYADTVDILLPVLESRGTSEEYSLLVRALANRGQLSEALGWCDRWLAAHKLDYSGHYLRAGVLQELGDREQARKSLQRAIYLEPELVLAHFALGNLARADGRHDEATRHLKNALQSLRRHPSEEALPESDGLTAGRLTGIITALLAIESKT